MFSPSVTNSLNASHFPLPFKLLMFIDTKLPIDLYKVFIGVSGDKSGEAIE